MPTISSGGPAGVTNGLPMTRGYTPPGAVNMLPPRTASPQPVAIPPQASAPPRFPRATVFTQGQGGWDMSHQMPGAAAETMQGLSINDALQHFGRRYGGPTPAPIQGGPTPAPPGQVAPPLQTNAPPMVPNAARIADARNWNIGGQ